MCTSHTAYFYVQFQSAGGVRGVKREEAMRVVQIRVKASRANLERRASRCKIFVVGGAFRGRMAYGGWDWRIGGRWGEGGRWAVGRTGSVWTGRMVDYTYFANSGMSDCASV